MLNCVRYVNENVIYDLFVHSHIEDHFRGLGTDVYGCNVLQFHMQK